MPTSDRPSRASLAAPRRYGQRTRTLLAAGGFSLHQTCEALVPIVVGIAIDRAIRPSDPWMLAASVAALAIVFVTLLSVWRVGELAATRAYLETTYGARRNLTARLLAPRATPTKPAGQVLSVLSSDVDEAASVVWIVPHAIAAGAAVLTASIALLLISPPLAALVLLGTPVVMLALHFVTSPLERRSGLEQAALADSSALAGDLLSGLRTVKGLGAEDEAIRRFGAVNDQSLAAALRSANAEGAYAGVSTLISGGFLVVLAASGASAVVAGDLTPGQLVTIVGLAQVLQWPIAGLGFVGAELAQARASAKRLGGLADEPAVTAVGLEHGPGAVEIRDVLLPSGGRLDAAILEGEIVAVVLEEQDATAVRELFAGSRAADGDILVDGARIEAPPPGGATPAVVVAPHEPTLFSGSVDDNVRSDGATDESLSRIAEAAVLGDVLAEDGWRREVGERGRLLSGGQRQRVALARALAAHPPVLVLHEPATSVDAVTQAMIADGIRRTRTGRTTILLTTSPALIGACDRIVRARTRDDLVSGGVPR